MIPTEQQKLIIESDSSGVVIAAPGSGKTFVLSQKIKKDFKRLLDHQGVIAISYTNKASNELKNRSLSGGEKPKSSFFGTIDKFNLSEIVIPFGKHLFGMPRNDFQIIKKDSLPEEDAGDLDWVNRSDDVTSEQIEQLITFFLKGVILIESIGSLADYVFRNSDACKKYIKARYKYIYIDEYQDSGLLQHNMFLQIIDLGITGVAVGDLNQSIYAFSGKDARFLTELTSNPLFKYFPLDKNHRCDPSIINYSNYFLNKRTELISTTQNNIMFFRIDGDEVSIAKWIDQQIEKIITELNVEHLSDIAILTKNKRTASIINSHLKTPHNYIVSNELDLNLNVWSSIFSGLLFFSFNQSYKFIDVIELFSSYDKFSKTNLRTLDACKKSIEDLIKEEVLNIESLEGEFVKIAEIIAPGLRKEESIVLLKNVLESKESLSTYQSGDPNKIDILTIHKSKGMEYEVVIHLDLYKWILPGMKPGANGDFNNPEFIGLDQDRNLHYVALTRAKKWCLLISSTKRTNSKGGISNGTDSDFLWDNGIKKLRYKNS